MYRYSCYGTSLKNAREKNEDYFQIFIESMDEIDYMIAAVCDGIGSKSHSDETAKECIHDIVKRIRRKLPEFVTRYRPDSKDWVGWWKNTLKEQIVETEQYLIQHFAPVSIGTTLTLLFMVDNQMMFLADCGDSPCYLLDADKKEIKLWSKIRNVFGENLEYNPEYYREYYKEKLYLKEHRRRLTAGIGFQNGTEEPWEKIHVDFMEIRKELTIALGTDGAFSTLTEKQIYETLMIPKEKEGVHLVEKAELLMGRCREEEKERDNQTLILIQISDAVDTEEENFDKEDR